MVLPHLKVFLISKEIIQSTIKGKRRRGRLKKRWKDNVKEWTGMDFASSTRAAENRMKWKGIVAKSSLMPHNLLGLWELKEKNRQSEVKIRK